MTSLWLSTRSVSPNDAAVCKKLSPNGSCSGGGVPNGLGVTDPNDCGGCDAELDDCGCDDCDGGDAELDDFGGCEGGVLVVDDDDRGLG